MLLKKLLNSNKIETKNYSNHTQKTLHKILRNSFTDYFCIRNHSNLQSIQTKYLK